MRSDPTDPGFGDRLRGTTRVSETVIGTLRRLTTAVQTASAAHANAARWSLEGYALAYDIEPDWTDDGPLDAPPYPMVADTRALASDIGLVVTRFCGDRGQRGQGARRHGATDVSTGQHGGGPDRPAG